MRQADEQPHGEQRKPCTQAFESEGVHGHPGTVAQSAGPVANSCAVTPPPWQWGDRQTSFVAKFRAINARLCHHVTDPGLRRLRIGFPTVVVTRYSSDSRAAKGQQPALAPRSCSSCAPLRAIRCSNKRSRGRYRGAHVVLRTGMCVSHGTLIGYRHGKRGLVAPASAAF